MFLNKFIYFALYQKHLLKVSTSCLSKDGDNIITKYKIQYNDKIFYVRLSQMQLNCCPNLLFNCKGRLWHLFQPQVLMRNIHNM